MSKSEGYKARYKARGSGRNRAAEGGNVTTTVANASDFKAHQNRIVLNAMQARLDAETDPVQRAKQAIAIAKRVAKNEAAAGTPPILGGADLRRLDRLRPKFDLVRTKQSLQREMSQLRELSDFAETKRQQWGRNQTEDRHAAMVRANRDEDRQKSYVKQLQTEYDTQLGVARRYNRAVDATTKTMAQAKLKTTRRDRQAANLRTSAGLYGSHSRERSVADTIGIDASVARKAKAARIDPAIRALKSTKIKVSVAVANPFVRRRDMFSPRRGGMSKANIYNRGRQQAARRSERRANP